MPVAAVASLQLARFTQLRDAGAVEVGDRPGVLFCRVGADTRAAGTDPASQQAFTFVVLGLHADADSAHRLVEDRHACAPWLADAAEAWAGVLQPIRHHGAGNHLDPGNPGPLFAEVIPSSDSSGPVVSVTTVGWNRDGLDMNRVREFGAGVAAVRISMTGVPGMHTQHSFFFPGVLAIDPLTVTFWRDEAALRDFAYGQGTHRRHLDRYRAEQLGDRTTFTRFRVLRAIGTWHGRDPLRFA